MSIICNRFEQRGFKKIVEDKKKGCKNELGQNKTFFSKVSADQIFFKKIIRKSP